MSIDQRLRTALHDEVEETPDVAALLTGWADVEDRAARRRTRDRATRVAVLAVAAVLVVAAAVVWWPREASTPEPVPPVPTPTVTDGVPPPEPLAFEGTWGTGPVMAQGIVDHLDAVGLGQWADAVLLGTPADATIEYLLKIQGGRVNIKLAIGDGPAVDQDLESYEVAGRWVVFSPIGSDCGATFDWRVRRERLRLLPVADTCPPYRGTPDIALMHALYGAYPFLPAD